MTFSDGERPAAIMRGVALEVSAFCYMMQSNRRYYASGMMILLMKAKCRFIYKQIAVAIAYHQCEPAAGADDGRVDVAGALMIY